MTKQFKWNELVVLDQNKYQYQPQVQQILQYAQFLGLKFPDDNRYKYLVIEGLKAQLPPFWQACQSPDGDICFRNKKTRIITTQNPLDQIYKSKISNLRLLQARNNFFPINQQSLVNESSGLYKSKLKNQDLKISLQDNKQQNKIMNRQITQQSIYSQKSLQYDDKYYNRSSLVKSNTLENKYNEQKTKHVLKLLQIKNNIMRMVPRQNQLITKVNGLAINNQKSILKLMDISKLERLSTLKTSIIQKRLRLQKLNEMKVSLNETKIQIKQSKTNEY